MSFESEIELHMESIRWKSPTEEIYGLLKGIISMLIDEGFSLADMKKILKHALVNEIIKKLDNVDDKLDFVLNCDYFWEYFDEKTKPDKYSLENIIKKYNKNSEKIIKELAEKPRTLHYKYTLNDL